MHEELAKLGQPDEAVLIGVVDGQPDLECATLSSCGLSVEQSMVLEPPVAPDEHGTEICSLIFGLPPEAEGLARGCNGLALPIFFARDGVANTRPATQMDLARALTLAAERNVDIVNVSAGQLVQAPEAGKHLKDALAMCDRRRMLVVAAAGNNGCDCLHVPAAISTVLAVGAMDDVGHPHETSNWGQTYASNGLLAPGVNVRVVGPGDRSSRRTGTSYASAIVSAVAGRLLAEARNRGYDLNALDVRSVLLDSTDQCDPDFDGSCERILAGKLNIDAAIALLHQRGRQAEITQLSKSQRFLKPSNLEISPMTEITNPTDTFTISNPADGVSPPDGTSSDATAPADVVEASGLVEQQACACGGDDNSENELKASGLQVSAAKAEQPHEAITQQSCGCGGGQPPQIVYALGSLWFDFGNEPRYDAIVQRMGDPVAANTPAKLFEHLQKNLEDTSGITFILIQDQIPVYAIHPSGPFALDIYRSMLDALKLALDAEGDMQRVAIPGFVAGTTRLMNGMTLPVIHPDFRGMARWETESLVESATLAAGAEKVDKGYIVNFLVRAYDELRNLGMTPEERALNFAATNAYQATTVFVDAMSRSLELHSISVKKSPICRPESDCWDVHLQMFDPENERRAGRIYRFTVDVSEVLPVTVGPMRSWAAPLVTM